MVGPCSIHAEDARKFMARKIYIPIKIGHFGPQFYMAIRRWPSPISEPISVRALKARHQPTNRQYKKKTKTNP